MFSRAKMLKSVLKLLKTKADKGLGKIFGKRRENIYGKNKR